MRIYQYLIDEQTLRNYLHEKEYHKAIELIDWYYSPKNPEGFDDPKEVTKARDVVADKDIKINFKEPFRVPYTMGQYFEYVLVF